MRCAPGNLYVRSRRWAVGAHFADEECSEPALRWPSADCPPAHVTAFPPADGCGAGSHAQVFRVAGELAQVYRSEPESGACVLDAPLSEGERAHALEPVPLEALARIEQIIE